MQENAHDAHNPEPHDTKRMSRVWLLGTGLVSLLLGVALGLAIYFGNENRPLAIDSAWLNLMVSERTPFWNSVALFFNDVGGGIVAILVIPILILAALFLAKRPWAALYYLAATLLSTAIVQLVKNLLGRARPEEILVHSDFGSYPSGHAANAAVMAVTLAIIFPWVWVWAAGALYTIAMMLSRTYLGAHWLSDTVGGLLLGAGTALVLGALLAPRLSAERERRRAPRRETEADAPR